MRMLGYSVIPVTIAYYLWITTGNFLWGCRAGSWPGWADDLSLAWFLFCFPPLVVWEVWFIRTRPRRRLPPAVPG